MAHEQRRPAGDRGGAAVAIGEIDAANDRASAGTSSTALAVTTISAGRMGRGELLEAARSSLTFAQRAVARAAVKAAKRARRANMRVWLLKCAPRNPIPGFSVASMPADYEAVTCLSRKAASDRFVIHDVAHGFAASLPVWGSA